MAPPHPPPPTPAQQLAQRVQALLCGQAAQSTDAQLSLDQLEIELVRSAMAATGRNQSRRRPAAWVEPGAVDLSVEGVGVGGGCGNGRKTIIDGRPTPALPCVPGQSAISPMPSSKSTYDLPAGAPSPVVKEEHIEYGFIGTLQRIGMPGSPNLIQPCRALSSATSGGTCT